MWPITCHGYQTMVRAVRTSFFLSLLLVGGCGAFSSEEINFQYQPSSSHCDGGVVPDAIAVDEQDAHDANDADDDAGIMSDGGPLVRPADGGIVDARSDSGIDDIVDAGMGPAACRAGEHREGDLCVANERVCATASGMGTQVWSGSSWGPCHIASCDPDFHEESGICLQNTRSCAFAHGTGEQRWMAGEWADCQLLSCAPLFHKEAGACVANVRPCAFAGGTGQQSWNGISWERCELTSCTSNHHVESGACAENVRACGIAHGAGQQQWANAGWEICVVTSCAADHHEEENACVPNLRACVTASGIGQEEWLGNMWSACGLQDCHPGFHFEDGTCIEDIQECQIANGTASSSWEDGAWGPCLIQSCNSGFHVQTGVCTADIRACYVDNGSGFERWSDRRWQPCEVTSCVVGYHIEAGECVLDSRSCPIRFGNGTQTWGEAGWQTCMVTTCEDNFSATENRCMPTDPASATYVILEKGTFTRGSPATEAYRLLPETQYAVTFGRDIALMKTEVTQGQWVSITGKNPSYWSACGLDCPVEMVDWHAALSYANELSVRAGLEPCYELLPATCADAILDWSAGDSLCTEARFRGLECEGYRLPTDSEWEFAYRAGSQTPYSFGGISAYGCQSSALSEHAWYCGNASGRTHPVAQKLANAWGIYDMGGNVWEWVYDRPEFQGTEHVTDPVGSALTAYRYLRGGGASDVAETMRAARFLSYANTARQWNIGFRLVRTLPE